MKKQNGITLIALVISIIVMLILAGVSINAVVGDNGVISKAQDTVFLNSCAYLEEYFNQLYATCAIDGAEEGDTPLHTIMKSGYQNYFFSTSEGACLKKVVVNEETGTNQTIALYLVKKEQLPEEIQAQLTGAEDLESRDYRKLRGCYGITSDLQAYYCEDGLNSIIKLELSDLNADSPDIIFAEQDSVLANVVNGGTAPITNQGLKTIKTLTIDSTEELSLLTDFSKFINLTTLYFANLNIENLNGIEGAANRITYVKFTNCNVQDYSAMNGLTNLTQLYLVKPSGKDAEIARLGSVEQGIASGEFSKLQYFGIVGNEKWLNNTTTYYEGDRYEITNISSLANFSETTKQAIKYMNLQNLQLTSISSLSGFTNVYFLRMECNSLTTFDGIQNMSNLTYLIAPYLYSNSNSTYTLGINEGTAPSTTDALRYIYKGEDGTNAKLYYLDLRSNSKLKYVDSLGECTAIRYLYMAECNNIQNASTMATTVGNCGSDYSINGAYGLDIISDTITVLSLDSKTMTIAEFEQLMNKTKITHLNLNKIKITTNNGTELTNATTPTFNEEVNKVLKTCTNLQYLILANQQYLTTVDFISNTGCKNIVELDLRNTGVTDLSNLNAYGTMVRNLRITNPGTDLTKIQNVISKCTGGSYWYGDGYNSLCLYDLSLFKQLNSCTEITTLTFGNWRSTVNLNQEGLDLTNMSSLSYINCFGLSNGYIILPGNSFSRVKVYKIGVTTSPTTSITDLIFQSTPESCIFDKNGNNILNTMDGTTITNVNMYQGSARILKYFDGLQIFTETLIIGSSGFNASEGIKDFTGINCFSSKLKKLSLANMANITSLDGLEILSNLESLTVEKMCYSSGRVSDISAISELTKLTSISMTYQEIADISPVSNLTELTSINFNYNKITDISSLTNLINLTYLNLDNNSIPDVYPLMNCTKLETLYIQNNTLTEFGYYKNASGQSIGYEVMDVFYDLNHAKKGSLKNLYISGNNFDDTEILLDLTWDAKSGF